MHYLFSTVLQKKVSKTLKFTIFQKGLSLIYYLFCNCCIFLNSFIGIPEISQLLLLLLSKTRPDRGIDTIDFYSAIVGVSFQHDLDSEILCDIFRRGTRI